MLAGGLGFGLAGGGPVGTKLLGFGVSSCGVQLPRKMRRSLASRRLPKRAPPPPPPSASGTAMSVGFDDNCPRRDTGRALRTIAEPPMASSRRWDGSGGGPLRARVTVCAMEGGLKLTQI